MHNSISLKFQHERSINIIYSESDGLRHDGSSLRQFSPL